MKEMAIESLLASYPRARPPLTDAHREIFVEEYKVNREGEGLFYGAIKLLESWHHKQVAKLKGPKTVLEIGAGSMNHVPYEPDTINYDCIEPFRELYENSPNLHAIRHIYTDIAEIPKEARYQRIFSIAVFEHLEDLPLIVAQSGLLLSSDGVFHGSIPSEGGLLWGLSWRLSTGIAYKLRTGLDYKTVMQHEHINDAKEIIAIIEYFFTNVKIRRFPFPANHLSFYTYIEATNPKTTLCHEFLNRRNQT